MSSKTQWTGRVVADTIGDARTVVLDDESTARVVLEDWLHDYYEIDDDEAECLSEHLCAPALTTEAREYAAGLFGLSVEFDSERSAERSAEAIYEYLEREGEPGAGRRCGDAGEGRIADVEIAAEYLYAAAHDEN